MYKMVDIGVKEFTDAKVHTIAIGNKKLFWVEMSNVQKKRKKQGLKTYIISQQNKFGVFMKLKILQKIKQGSIKGVKNNWTVILVLILGMIVVTLFVK